MVDASESKKSASAGGMKCSLSSLPEDSWCAVKSESDITLKQGIFLKQPDYMGTIDVQFQSLAMRPGHGLGLLARTLGRSKKQVGIDLTSEASSKITTYSRACF